MFADLIIWHQVLEMHVLWGQIGAVAPPHTCSVCVALIFVRFHLCLFYCSPLVGCNVNSMVHVRIREKKPTWTTLWSFKDRWPSSTPSSSLRRHLVQLRGNRKALVWKQWGNRTHSSFALWVRHSLLWQRRSGCEWRRAWCTVMDSASSTWNP